jgi:hypothetical protein
MSPGQGRRTHALRAPDREDVPLRRDGTATWFAFTGTLLGGAAPLLLMSSTPLSPASSPAWVGAWLLSIAVGLRYAWLVARGERRLFEISFWLFTYVFLGLAPLVQMRSGSYPGTTPNTDLARNGTVVVLIAVGVVAFVVGNALAGRSPAPTRGQPRVDPPHVLVLVRCALLFSAYYLVSVGLSTVLSSRSARSVAAGAAWPSPPVTAVVSALATLPLVVAFAALCLYRRQRREHGLTGPAVLPVVLLLAVVVLLNPLSSPRYVAGTAGLSVLVALGAVATRRRTRVFGVAVAVGLVLVFPYADVARYAGQTGSGKTGGPAKVLASPDFDAFDQINNALVYVERVRPAPGRQFLGALLFFVPRNAWPSKPEDTGIVLAEFRNYKVTNLSAPLWAEAYVNGGWLVLVAVMLALGAGVRRWDMRMSLVRPLPVAPGVLETTLPFYAIIMLRGSLLQSMAGLTVLLVCGRYVSARRTGGQDEPAAPESSAPVSAAR